MICACLLSTVVVFQDERIASEPEQQWTRRVDGENIASLEVVSRKYVAEGLPSVWLVGVAHIADLSFYDQVAALLEGLDVVLYESVRPTGSRPPMGDTHEERVASTKKSLKFISDTAAATAKEMDIYPMTMEDVIADASILDTRLSGWLDDVAIDAWGNPIVLHVDEDSGEMTCMSYGADGKVGGQHEASDLIERRTVSIAQLEEEVTEEELELELVEDETDPSNLQAAMAETLGLAFQLDSLPYEEPHWFVSDLTIDEVQVKLEENGADTTLLETLSGESFAAKLAEGVMQIVPMLDALSGGGATATARLLMIEVLSMADNDQMIAGIGEGLQQVIIVDRNTEVLTDLATIIDATEDVSSIGILYGAGHMSDLAHRMETLFGYQPVEDRWFSSMRVDPRESLLSEGDMTRMRFMLKYQMYKSQEAQSEETDAKKE